MKKITEQEAISNINSKLKENTEFIGFLNNEWIGSRKTYLILRCKIHNKIQTISYKSFIADGWRCKDCYHESKKLSPENALKKILKIHKDNIHNYKFIVPDDFDISKGNEDVIVICPIHGEFRIKYTYLIKRDHKNILCPKCNNIRKELTEKDIISDVSILVDNLNKNGKNISFLGIYGKFNGSKTKIKLLCNIHNEIGTPEYYSLMKNNSWMCSKCRLELVKKSNTITAEEAQRRVFEKFKGDRRGYDYSRVKDTFTGYNNDVTVICPIHGEFRIKFRTLISNKKDSGNCPKCLLENKIYGINKSIEIVKLILSNHNLIFNQDISFLYFIETEKTWKGIEKSHIRLKCNRHNIEFTTTYKNLRNNIIGCSRCSKILLKSENYCYDLIINSNFVDVNDIERNYYIYKVKDLTKISGIRKYIKVDFYIKSRKIIIEFDGEQHYRNIGFIQKSYEKFVDQVNRDNCLENYCTENEITLLRIPWIDRKRIPEILKAFFEEGKDITTKVEPKLLPIPYGENIINRS